MKTSHFILLAFLAALINIIPLLLIVPAGDTVMNYAQIGCYSKQLWSGIFYPRWCMDANAGLGSPAPIFYFPLPFYITALFYPLHVTVEQQYLLGVYAANVVAFITCVIWLKRIVRLETACLCAFIFLWCGYRAELLTRTSYAEYWCVAFFPLLFHYARELCRSWKNWPQLTIAIAVCMFCHAPVTLIGLIGVGLYVLIMSEQKVRTLAALFGSCVLAMMLGLFHYLPMKTLTPTLNDEIGGYSYWQKSWINSFINQPQIVDEHWWMLFCLGVSMLGVMAMMGAFFLVRKRIIGTPLYREALCWLIIAAAAAFMLFSPSAPLWWIVEYISGVRTPWRMTSLIMLASVFVSAVVIQYGWAHRKTRKGDAALVAFFFVLTGLFYYGGVTPETRALHEQAIHNQYIIKYFATHDMDAAYGKIPEHFIRDEASAHAEWAKGKGMLTIEKWNVHGMRITGHANGKNLLRLEHFNYPIWRATLNDAPVSIQSEPATGRIMIAIPPGDFKLIVTQNYPAMLPENFWLVWLAMIVSAALIMIGLKQSLKLK